MTVIAGKYEVLRVIGEGTTGKVYLVRHIDLGSTFALKVLSRGLSHDPSKIERFKQEAAIISRFSHPHTVQFRDFGRTEGGHYYMTMDYCEGTSLKDLLVKYGRFEIGEALEIMDQLLSVLDAAHGLGIIHRDIKPDNIVLQSGPEGVINVKVLDFGIAKLKEAVHSDASNTSEGVAIGTPLYMSPEQAAAETEPDSRADLYSAGILFYELLCGDVPFRGDSVIQTLLKHLTQPVPRLPEEFNVPLLVEQLVFRSLEKAREDRFQTAAEFREACLSTLRQLREGVTEAAAIYSELPERGAESIKPANLEGSGKKVLYLDDDQFTLQIVSHILEREGYTVQLENKFSGIYNHLFNERADLFLCDVCMPGTSGPKVCEMIRQILPDLKIVLFSNLPEQDLDKISRDCLASGWISKNKKPSDWLREIKEFLESSAPPAEPSDAKDQ